MKALALLPVLFAACTAHTADISTQPNILFILTDDQGWPTLGCYGSTAVPTPHHDPSRTFKETHVKPDFLK